MLALPQEVSKMVTLTHKHMRFFLFVCLQKVDSSHLFLEFHKDFRSEIFRAKPWPIRSFHLRNIGKQLSVLRLPLQLLHCMLSTFFVQRKLTLRTAMLFTPNRGSRRMKGMENNMETACASFHVHMSMLPVKTFSHTMFYHRHCRTRNGGGKLWMTIFGMHPQAVRSQKFICQLWPLHCFFWNIAPVVRRNCARPKYTVLKHRINQRDRSVVSVGENLCRNVALFTQTCLNS